MLILGCLYIEEVEIGTVGAVKEIDGGTSTTLVTEGFLKD
jgi:hypothetical protein